jgi:hypothetical protein
MRPLQPNLLAVIAVALLVCGGCGEKPVEPKEKINPNLKLLT